MGSTLKTETALEYQRMATILQKRMADLGMFRPRHLIQACRETGWKPGSDCVYRWLNGEVMPRLIDLPLLAKALQWTPGELAAALWPE